MISSLLWKPCNVSTVFFWDEYGPFLHRDLSPNITQTQSIFFPIHTQKHFSTACVEWSGNIYFALQRRNGNFLAIEIIEKIWNIFTWQTSLGWAKSTAWRWKSIELSTPSFAMSALLWVQISTVDGTTTVSEFIRERSDRCDRCGRYVCSKLILLRCTRVLVCELEIYLDGNRVSQKQKQKHPPGTWLPMLDQKSHTAFCRIDFRSQRCFCSQKYGENIGMRWCGRWHNVLYWRQYWPQFRTELSAGARCRSAFV